MLPVSTFHAIPPVPLSTTSQLVTMKFFLATFLVAILVVLAMAADKDLKPVIVSYPDGTPKSELEELKDAIIHKAV